ncbi:hypothetical protein [Psychrobacter celer]|uniref:hypothetical protein n=1 Tax=Psychrobacter celer TaxID=306572 RepID=UPI0018E0460C|nr:hypothetical protein [Psychrobacter celer]
MIVSFSTLQVLVDGNLVKNKDLDILFDNSEQSYQDKDTYYLFDEIRKLTDDVYWFYAKIGCTTPYSEDVVDTKTYESMKNPREIDLLEPNKQLFCFYDNKTKLLFINNLNLKGKVESFFQRKLDSLEKQSTVSVSNVFSNPDRFIETLSLINQVKFKYREDLFNTTTLGAFDMLPQPKELLGLAPSNDVEYELSIKMKEANVTKDFLEKFRELVGMRKDGLFRDLVCIGKDKNHLDTIFRLDNMTKKIDISVNQDKKTKLFDPNDITKEFLKKLERTDCL